LNHFEKKHEKKTKEKTIIFIFWKIKLNITTFVTIRQKMFESEATTIFYISITLLIAFIEISPYISTQVTSYK